ncbi:MAG: hypothetical protein RSC56_06545 [Acidaminococcaceae bacterium]
MSTKKARAAAKLQIEFVCPKCGRHLAWALPSVMMSCPACGKWITQKNTKTATEGVYLPLDSNQLVLFR